MSNNDVIIAHCGLCCTNCGMFIKQKCLGCHSDKPMNRNCEMKACSIGRGYSTCASCNEFKDFKQCKKLYNIISRFFCFIFKTNRIGNLNRIKEIGLDNFKKEKITDKKA
jgi:hypothetical protein